MGLIPSAMQCCTDRDKSQEDAKPQAPRALTEALTSYLAIFSLLSHAPKGSRLPCPCPAAMARLMPGDAMDSEGSATSSESHFGEAEEAVEGRRRGTETNQRR